MTKGLVTRLFVTKRPAFRAFLNFGSVIRLHEIHVVTSILGQRSSEHFLAGAAARSKQLLQCLEVNK